MELFAKMKRFPYMKVSVLIGLLILILYTYSKEKVKKEEFDQDEIINDERQTETNPKFDYIKDGACHKSEPPFSQDWLKEEFSHFIKVYEHRPKLRNQGGTKLAHQFALWATIRWLKPLHIIESGVYRGMGTWMIRQAAPRAQLILLDPNLDKQTQYTDTHNDTFYYTNKKFIDFTRINWDALNIDKKRTLVFFDDHRSEIVRTKDAFDRGFRYLMFDDNYSGPTADNLSMRMGCWFKNGIFQRSQISYNQGMPRAKKAITQEHVDLVYTVFNDLIDVYYEYHVPWDLAGHFPRVLFPGITTEEIKSEYGLKRMDKEYTDSVVDYYNICFVILKEI